MPSTILSRMLKLAKLQDVQKAARVATPAGDNVIPMFPEVKTRCMSAANYPNECVYSIVDNFRRCKFCGQPSGLDR